MATTTLNFQKFLTLIHEHSVAGTELLYQTQKECHFRQHFPQEKHPLNAFLTILRYFYGA